ncbi:hypothetical protein F442_02084 [Phytophthora nicotianae P10297]|uniref:Uncharacterized protein n=3 Tax=Phytophthora nicotianae TaxID=4792 RepID=W2PFY4_PHYN3|nr:hypothetical protein PPTG_24529 [Phytophthora nicotianae INRA-310]ETI55183.1 hypothetical protein F443_02126 [Phytophthora nicotianae P1569]ETM98919.1 hypothetical protein PPTG_24529 [Phytophthora nicotianae INRA-310]ETP52990.1 hypothetical protein F442_02084 [Phytophthora nicotianae P10297]
MRRRERANMVVVSSEEKYCYATAVFGPVIDYLAVMSSRAFYAALQLWREIIRNGFAQPGVYSSDSTTVPAEDLGSGDDVDGGLDSDTVSEIKPADMIDTIGMIRDMEQSEHV